MTSSDWLFAKEAFKKIGLNGAIFPSSKFLALKMVRPIVMKDKITIVELGAGTGSLTKILAEKLPKDGRLFVFEINPTFVNLLIESFKDDKRVTIVSESAENFGKILKKNGINKADYVVSGLPLGVIPRTVRLKIFREIQNYLAPDGIYIQFQYFLSNWMEIRKFFKGKIESVELRNVPPAFLYVCRHKL